MTGEVLETVGEIALTAGTATLAKGAAKGTQEIVEAGVKKGLKELAEEGTEKAVKELIEEGAEKAAKELAEKAVKETGEKAGKRAVVKTAKKPSYKHGHSDGGPGTWEHRTTPSKGAEYQQHVTGAPKDTEDVVKTDKMKSGEKKFDGYDPETNTLQDAKDWDKWPPEGDSKFDRMMREKEIKEIKNSSDIAKEAGCDLEYHVPTEARKKQVLEMLGDDIPDNFDVVVTSPKK